MFSFVDDETQNFIARMVLLFDTWLMKNFPEK